MADLIVHSVSRRFKTKQVLSAVSLTCSTGDILGLFGRNGSGKSTLLKILCGLIKADSIEITLGSKAFNPFKEGFEGFEVFAYLPQHTFIPRDLKLQEIIKLYHQDKTIQQDILNDKMIAQMMHHKVYSLSPGELKYFEILLICKLKRPFLLLDEPFSMVEPLYRASIRELLLAEKSNKGIIITDHYFRDVLAIADHYLLLKDGYHVDISEKNDLITNRYLPGDTVFDV